MPLNTIRMDIQCEHCQAKAEISESVITNHRRQSLAKLGELQFALPEGWLSLDWLSKAKEGEGIYNSDENVLDSADFCSIECVIKHFQKRRRFLLNEVKKMKKEREERYANVALA